MNSSAASNAHAGHHGHGGHAGAGEAGKSYLLDLKNPRLPVREKTDLRFAVLPDDGTGRPLTSYEEEHGKQLHLIVASRDLGVYRHLHPVLGGDGVWSVSVELPRAGEYRLFADFRPRGESGVVIGADLTGEGVAEAAELPAVSTIAEIDGYEVRLDGVLEPGQGRALTLTVSKGGRPVTDLQPYFGAYGHLVALRAGDLAYLHVHPTGEPGDGETPPGPEVAFFATAPSSGAYRLFLDFRHDGVVRTAAFTVRA
ncbi:hypothetical protein ACFRI7_38010 [Streptomyces sp. NPDC056716]|uniref:hypothetical protein n=1 Tax=unclassified Streptomyces TaxID=2593676 RepID=UPI003696B229